MLMSGLVVAAVDYVDNVEDDEHSSRQSINNKIEYYDVIQISYIYLYSF